MRLLIHFIHKNVVIWTTYSKSTVCVQQRSVRSLQHQVHTPNVLTTATE